MDTKTIECLNKQVELHTRKGKGGVTFKYVKGGDVVEALNTAFEHEWSSEVLETTKEDGYIIIRMRLTVNIQRADGTINSVYKESYGGAEIKKRSNDGSFVDLSNDYKTAMTNALKKAAEQYGIALKLDDYNDESYVDDKPYSSNYNKSYSKPAVVAATPSSTPTEVHNPKAASSTTIKVSSSKATTKENDNKILEAKKLLEGLSSPADTSGLGGTKEEDDNRPKEFPRITDNDLANSIQVGAIESLCEKNSTTLVQVIESLVKLGYIDNSCLNKEAKELTKAQAVPVIKFLVSPKVPE